jgi:heat shock protein HtpX
LGVDMFEDQIRSNINKTWGFILGFIVFFTILIYLLGYFFAEMYGDPSLAFIFLIAALAFSIISSWVSYYYSDRMVISAVGARPADPILHKQLYDLVEGLTIASGVPAIPRLYVMDEPSPNAFATGRNPEHSAIVVTSGLLEMLSRDELEGVLAHEMSHVVNYDILLATIISVLVGTVVLISHFFWRWMWWGGGRGRRSGNGGGSGYLMLIILALALLFIILAPIASQLIQLAVSRKREYLADASAVKLTRYPDGLANALHKIAYSPIPVRRANKAVAHMFIDDPFKKRKGSSWLANLFSTHPPIDDRIARIQAM